MENFDKRIKSRSDDRGGRLGLLSQGGSGK